VVDRIRQGGDFSIPSFSREAVLHLYRFPPKADAVKEYVNKLVEEAKSSNRHVFVFYFSLETPLTIHTRWPYLPLEIGIAWHPILNIPYIPASALNGALSAAAPSQICGIDKAKLFGTQEEEGLLVVLDAYPISWDKPVEPDVLTPHYHEVEGRISEVQAEPRPLVFPVVPPGTTFAFVAALRKQVDVTCQQSLLNTLKVTLSQGLGAKTALGYGILKQSGQNG
jgi:CRISPR-associated protein Cmr6